jgi:exodeoxyribonuclease (lambda-induced)
MKIHNFEQRSPEWFAVRKGKMTASNATAIGNHAKGLETYITEMMSEFYSSETVEKFSNKDTDRGNLLEPVARDIYAFENDVEVEEVGFVEYNEFVGCSPDGLVGKDGGVEIKCVNDIKHFKHILFGERMIESDYIWQVQMNLLITGRKWWDLVYYNPNFKHSMCVYRIYPDQEKFEALQKGFEIGSQMITNIKQKIGNV